MSRVNGLLELPGIGEKSARKLIDHFGSEAAALEVLRRRDVASLAGVPGIGEKYAVSLVHEVIALEEGVSVGEFLQTPEAFAVYDRIVGLIRSYAHTPYSRARLSTFIPYPAKKAERIRETQAILRDYIGLAEKLGGDPELGAALRKIRYPREPARATKSRDRAVFTDSRKDYEKLLAEHIDRYLDVYCVDDMGELVDVAKGYPHSIVLGSRFAGADFPEDMDMEFLDGPAEAWWLVPEAVIAFFAANKEPIEASLDVVRAIRSKSGHGICPYMDDATMLDLSREMRRITPEGGIEQGIDPEVDRLKGVLDRHAEALKAAVKKANAGLHDRLENNTVTLKGSQLLGMFGERGEAGLKGMLEKEVAKAYADAVAEAKAYLKDALALKPFEMQYVDLVFREEIVYPIEPDHRAVDGFRNSIHRQLARRSLDIKRNCAKRLARAEAVCRDLARDTLEFDTYFAIGLFALDFGLRLPAVVERPGIRIEGGRSAFLRGHAQKVEPVSYAVGVEAGGTKGERVVILSGVNSGGKTTMLELLAQAVILAHMGFPVPADAAEIGLADELLYFSKSKGTLTAGAFETTIRNFSRIVDGRRKVVLVDELESITEPGASARIIAGILETLHDDPGAVAVFVSHLAEQIRENAACDVRVDGIEARGLDASLNLIVDRTPRYYYLAKSTPELIVERLTRSATGDAREFYRRLLAKFRTKN